MSEIIQPKKITFKPSGIPEKLKVAVQAVSKLTHGSQGFFAHLNDKIDYWYSDNYSLIDKRIPDFKFYKTKKIDFRKSLQRWWGENNNQQPVSINIDNLNVLCLYAVGKTWTEYSEELSEQERNLFLFKISKRSSGVKENGYFERYLKKIEQPFKDDGLIDYTRSFNVLLYMFGNESFNEFRAFDMAFDRWKQLMVDVNQTSGYSQIKNYPMDIMHETEYLCVKGRCKDFRRICVVPEIKIISDLSTTISVLKMFQDIEWICRLN